MSVTLVVFKQRPGDFHLSFDGCFLKTVPHFVIFVRFGGMTDDKVEACSSTNVATPDCGPLASHLDLDNSTFFRY